MKSKTEIPSHNILKSVGVSIKKDGEGMKFVYENQKVINDLKQIGFSLDVLKFQGGQLTLPELEQHLSEQSALEAYWASQAEEARYKFQTLQDAYDIWWEKKYAYRFNYLKDKKGILKPTEKEVKASMALKYSDEIEAKKNKLAKAEHTYRVLNNAIYTSIVTKGKMLQSLRNVIQGSGQNKFTIGVEEKGIGCQVKV